MAWEDHAVPVLPPDAPRADWLAVRRLGLGSSDARVLMGEGYADESLYKLLADKLTVRPDTAPTIRLRRGTYMEQFIADEFTTMTKLTCERQGLWRSIEHPIFQCTPDRRLPTGAGLETKNVEDYGSAKAYRDNPGVPSRFWWQLIDCLLVTGAPGWWLAIDSPYYEEPELRYVSREEVGADLGRLVEVGEDFWTSHVVNRFDLAADARSDQPRRAEPVTDVEAEATLPEMVEEAWRRWTALKYSGSKAGKAELEELGVFLDSQNDGGAKVLKANGVPLFRLQRYTAPGQVRREELERDHPGLLELYTTPGTQTWSWVAIKPRGVK